MTEQDVNIERRGEMVSELAARVVKDEKGRPRLMPEPGTVSKWFAVLGRHAGKGSLRLAISRVSQRRSDAQNRLLWGVVYAQVLDALRELAFEVGETCPFRDAQELHEALKHRFIGASVVRVAGEEMEIPPSTTTLTVEQFSAYVKSITEWASTKGIYVELQESA